MQKRYPSAQLLFIAVVFLSISYQSICSIEKTHAVVVYPDGKEIDVEIAETEMSRKLGLMFRERLDWDEGMLFIFENDDFHSIWMKNCMIPLDIIWLSTNGKIVHIKHSAQPCPGNEDCQVFTPFQKSRYVLEVKSGTAKKFSLKQGDEVLLLGIHGRKE